jgi:hypothetical protein
MILSLYVFKFIKFTPAHLNDVLENIKKQVKELNYLESSQKEEKDL